MQPEHMLSTYDAFGELEQAHYSCGNETYIKDPWHALLVKTKMNTVVEHLAEALNEEICVSFDTYLGKEPHWNEITLLDAMQKVVAQGSSRFTVGWPLCRSSFYIAYFR
jgi:hypothetical protein